MIEVKNLRKSFSGEEILKGITTKVEKKDRLVIVGPSGSGKSTFLRCLNLLEKPTSGEIFVDGDEITEERTDINKVRQKMGMVFQQFNLFPHLTIEDNITLAPIKLKGIRPDEAKAKAHELLQRINLDDKTKEYPKQLSGGQQQRIAIIRALAMDPEVLLFDEPTSALDPAMVGEVLTVIKELAVSGMTMVMVTHEMGFAREVANRVVFMEDGQFLEENEPKEFFGNPKHPKLQNFLSKIL